MQKQTCGSKSIDLSPLNQQPSCAYGYSQKNPRWTIKEMVFISSNILLTLILIFSWYNCDVMCYIVLFNLIVF